MRRLKVGSDAWPARGAAAAEVVGTSAAPRWARRWRRCWGWAARWGRLCWARGRWRRLAAAEVAALTTAVTAERRSHRLETSTRRRARQKVGQEGAARTSAYGVYIRTRYAGVLHISMFVIFVANRTAHLSPKQLHSSELTPQRQRNSQFWTSRNARWYQNPDTSLYIKYKRKNTRNLAAQVHLATARCLPTPAG